MGHIEIDNFEKWAILKSLFSKNRSSRKKGYFEERVRNRSLRKIGLFEKSYFKNESHRNPWLLGSPKRQFFKLIDFEVTPFSKWAISQSDSLLHRVFRDIIKAWKIDLKKKFKDDFFCRGMISEKFSSENVSTLIFDNVWIIMCGKSSVLLFMRHLVLLL